MKIENNTLFSKSEELLEAPMEDSLALMSMDNGKYYGLNEVGRVIWEKLDTEISFQKLIDELLQVFEIDRLTCERQSKEFLIALSERDIISIKNF